MHNKLLSSSFMSFVIGDLLTTYIGLYYYPNQIVESNPLPAYLINEFGLVSLLIVKVLIFSGFYILYKLTPNPHNIGIPIGLTSIGVAITGWNTLLLVSL